MGSTSNESILAIKTDLSGNQYVAGYFSGTVDFDPGAGVTNLTSAGSYDIFIAKYDSEGSLVWAKRIGSSTGNDVAWGLALDASNNVHVTGYFNGVADFDPGAGTSNMSSAGLDIFVLKLDTNGNFIWSRKMGGTDLDQAYDIAVDGSGNVYTTGYFTNSADFDPGAGSTILTVGSLSVEAAFISVLNSSGNFVAAKQITGTDAFTRGLRIRLDASNNVYLCGYFGGTVDFDPNAGIVNMTSTGSENAYVMKLNSSLNYVWAKRTGGTAETRANGMDLDGSGNVIVTGQYIGTVDFDPGAGTTNLTSVNSNDIYVQKLDASGNFSWARSMGGTMDNYGLSVKVDQNNEIYVAGQFSGTVDFDPGAGTTNLSATGSFDLFVTKLNTSGNFILARKIGGSGVDYLNNITTLGASQIFIGGYFEGTVDFDINAGVSNLSSSGARDIFLTKWDFCTIPPSTPGSISGSSSLCAGSSSSYSVTAVAGATTYNWTLPAGWSGASANTSITGTSGSSGTITLSASNGCGSSGIVSFPVTVLTIPSTPGTISGNANVCLGSSSAYSVSSVPGATSYVWTLPVGWTGSSTTATINGTVNSSGTVTVAASNTCGTSGVSSFPVSILTTPSTPGSISGNTTVCSATSENYTIANVLGATSYNWTMPAGWSGSSSTTAISSVAGSSGTITVSASNACGTSGTASLPITVNTIPASPAMINGINPICEGASTAYAVAPVSGATSYFWTLPVGWSGTSTTESVVATAGTSGGAITVSSTNQCGSSTPASMSVTVNQIPTITGSTVTICAGESATLTASTNFGTIEWFDTPTGGTSLGSGTSFTTGALTSSTTYYVEGNNNSCLNDPRFAINVNVNQLPTVTGSSVTICAGESANLAASTDLGTLEWFNTPTGGTSLGSGTSFSTGALTSSTTYYVEGNNNSCLTDPRFAIDVTVDQLPTVTGSNVTICAGESANLSASTDLGTLEWFNTPTGGTSLGSGTSYSTGILTGSAVFYVEANNNGCFNDPRFAVNVTVNAMPNINLNPGGGAIASLQDNATSYQWIDCNNSNAAIPNETAQILQLTQIGSYAVIIDLNGCVDTSACEIITSIGLEEVALSTITLYPNPSSTDFTVKSEKGISTISVYSVSGELVQHVECNGVTLMELQPNVNPGVYMVNVIDSETQLHVLQWIKL